MLSLVLLTATLFSFNKDAIQQPFLTDTTGTGQTTTELADNSPLLYEETFTQSSFFPNVRFQTSTTYGIAKSSPTFANGKNVARFELRDTDPMIQNGTRAEVSFPEPIESKVNRWYAFNVYFPAESYGSDSHSEVISQWHQGGGISPSISLETRADRYRLMVRPDPTKTEKIDLGAIIKDKWNSIVFHIVHSEDSDAIVEVWINGEKKIARTGDNMYGPGDGPSFTKPKWKIGIYKWDWNGDKTTDTRERVLYFDNIRMGKATANYNDMTSKP